MKNGKATFVTLMIAASTAYGSPASSVSPARWPCMVSSAVPLIFVAGWSKSARQIGR